MKVRNKLFLSTLSLAIAAIGPAIQPAFAQGAAAAVAAGAQVKDTQGGDVGTVTQVDGQFVILKTDKHEVRLPVSSFTAHQGHFIMAMTRDQLNAEVEKTKATASAKLAPGAAVTSTAGGNVGTIEAVEGEFVTLKLPNGKLVRLPRAAIAASANGGVVDASVVTQLEAAAAQAGDGAAAPAAAKAETKAQAKPQR